MSFGNLPASAVERFNVSGKLAHYTPEQGGDTIVSVRAESIASVSIESRDLVLVDIAHHTVRRLIEARKNEIVQDNYPYYDYSALAQRMSTLLD
jgi:RPA family protein